MIAAPIPPRRAWDGDAAPQGSRLASAAALLIMLLFILALGASIYGLVGLVMGIA